MKYDREIELKNNAIINALNNDDFLKENYKKRIMNCTKKYQCHDKFCCRCQENRRKKYFYVVKKILADRKKEYENKSIRPTFLFLTVDTPNVEAVGDNIRESILRIIDAYKMTKKRNDLKEILLGDFWGIDIQNFRWSKYMMIHLHSILVVKGSYHSKNYITKGRWLNLFQDVRDKSKFNRSVSVKEISMEDVPKVASYIVKIHKVFDEIMTNEVAYYSLNLDYETFCNMCINLRGIRLSGRCGYFLKKRKQRKGAEKDVA